MQHEYRYRKHIRWGQYVIPVAYAVFALLFAGVPVAVAFVGGRSVMDSGFGPILAAGIILFLAEGAVAGYLYHRMAGVRVAIDEDGVVYRYHKSEKRIPYQDISQLQCPSVRYRGGWLKIVSGKETIRLTVVIEHIGELVQRLVDELDARGLSPFYDRKKLFRFLKTATYADGSWERIYEGFWRFTLLTLLSIALGVAFGVLAGLGIASVLFWALLGFVWPFVAYYVTEFLFGRRVKCDTDEGAFTCPERDREREGGVYRKTFLLAGWIYVGLSATLVILRLVSG